MAAQKRGGLCPARGNVIAVREIQVPKQTEFCPVSDLFQRMARGLLNQFVTRTDGRKPVYPRISRRSLQQLPLAGTLPMQCPPCAQRLNIYYLIVTCVFATLGAHEISATESQPGPFQA